VRSLFVFIYISVSFSFVRAEEVPHCLSNTSLPAFYACVIENHPKIQATRMSIEAATMVRDKIIQLPNPSLSLNSIQGKNGGENEGNTSLEVSVNLNESLFKRSSLGKLGKAEEKIIVAEAQEIIFQIQFQVIKNFYRYRQLLDELDLVMEAIDTFKKIENQFKTRKARGPEQSVTLNLVELAQGDYALRKNHLNMEKSGIETEFKGIFGNDFNFKKEWLPPLKANWPEMRVADLSKNNLELMKLEAEKDKVEAEKSIATIESWPQVSVGPSIERNTFGINQYIAYGFNLTVDLPILSTNSAGRSFASKNSLRIQKLYEYSVKKARLENQLLLQKYSSAAEALKKSISIEVLKKKHNEIDNLFRQGLAPGSAVIEVHRQISEFRQSQHEHEIEALEALMSLNFLSGKEVEEVLK